MVTGLPGGFMSLLLIYSDYDGPNSSWTMNMYRFIHMSNFWHRMLNRRRLPAVSDLDSSSWNEVSWSGTLHQHIHIITFKWFFYCPKSCLDCNIFWFRAYILGWVRATDLGWYGLFKSKLLYLWKPARYGVLQLSGPGGHLCPLSWTICEFVVLASTALGFHKGASGWNAAACTAREFRLNYCTVSYGLKLCEPVSDSVSCWWEQVLWKWCSAWCPEDARALPALGLFAAIIYVY